MLDDKCNVAHYSLTQIPTDYEVIGELSELK
jgi:hypothetical protein